MSINSLSTIYATYNATASYFNSPPADQKSTVLPTGPWRPPQWNIINQNQLFMIKTGIQTTIPGTTGTPAGTMYFFDAIMKVEHTAEMRITEHPIQIGANIVDHAYQMPVKLRMEIGMSDAMDSLLIPNPWTNASTKSVSAYQTLIALMQSRINLQIHTRLINYQNMLIESVFTSDDYKTQFGGKFTVMFRQIITAQVPTITTASRSVDQNNSLGTINPQTPTSTSAANDTATGGTQ